VTFDEEAFEARRIDLTRPSAARLYDLYLGGDNHYAVDQVFADRMFQICPFLGVWARHNREFLRRAAAFCAEQGVRQFLDIGSGIPTAGNTHQVVRELAPEARVVYADNDQVAVTESRYLLGDTAGVAVVEADLREPESILDHGEVTRLIDFAEPVALLIVSVLPFVPDRADPRALLARYRDRLPSGSYVALSHAAVDEASAEAREQVAAVAREYGETSDPATTRTRDEFTGFFDGLRVLPPGVVYAPDWRPERPVDTDDPARPCNYAAVGYKP
jgi:hypothetical protein